jgi:hypothetical protein
MNITPETIAEMASMERTMSPEQALQNMDNVCQAYSGTREQHYILRSAVRLLASIVREHKHLKSELAVLRGEEEEAAPEPNPDAEVVPEVAPEPEADAAPAG